MSKKNTPPPATPSPTNTWWPLAAGLLVLAFALLEIYGPALNGPFLFDDRYLPFLIPGFADNPLRAWVVGVRPILMVTYWANTRMFGLDPYWFHFVNLLLHAAAGVCVWYIAKKLTQHKILSAFCALIFLLHPLQTESVSYIASRSEVAAGLFFLAAWAVFLYRKEQAISIGETLLVMALYGMAVLTKEHTVVLIVVLLLTDYFFNPGFTLEGIRKNWKLYGGLVLAGIAPVLFLLRTLRFADSAGFNMKDLTATDYLLTQVRALWVYFRLYLLPSSKTSITTCPSPAPCSTTEPVSASSVGSSLPPSRLPNANNSPSPASASSSSSSSSPPRPPSCPSATSSSNAACIWPSSPSASSP